MKLDPVITCNDAYNCLDNLIVDVAKWWNRDFELYFAESWGFHYKQINPANRETFGKNLHNGRNYGWEYLKKYHGIKVTFHKETDYRNILQVIRAELRESRPVVIYMNSYWCPWYASYFQEINSSHFCLVVDIDDENNLYILDSQMATEGTVLSEDYFAKGFGEYITFSLQEPKPVNKVWMKIIENAVERVMKPDGEVCIFDQMRNFADDISEKLNFELEIQGNEARPYRSDLFRTVLDIGRSRRQFSFTLKYLGNLTNKTELISLSEKMNNAGEKWESIFGVLCKLYYLQGTSRDRILKRVINKIKELTLEEESIAENLLKLSKNDILVELDPLTKFDKQLHKKPLKDYRYIDISSHMNNQGFSHLLSPDCKAEISNGGRYFLTEGLPADREWIVENMKFLFPEIEQDKNDNISCFGQVIDIQPGKFNHLMVLGCAEFANHSDPIEILYCDGHTEIFSLQLTSWITSKPIFNEVIAWTGKGAVRIENKVDVYPFPVNLFAQIYPLQHSAKIKSIKLPECPNLHVFAITLARGC